MTIDALAFRNALGSFATGVTIITTHSDALGDVGVTANSFNSVSIDPPLVLWSIARTSASLAAFTSAPHFAVHILSAEQQALSDRFAKRGVDKFADLEVGRGAGDIPLLEGCSARLQCRSAYQYEGGDHVIIVGEVIAHDHSPGAPLLFHGGRYARKESAEIAHVTADHADLSQLLQRSYFHLLTPVRAERERLGIALHDHYLLGVLFADPHTVAGVDRLIAYTGVRATETQADDLVTRGLVRIEESDNGAILHLTTAGREAMVGLTAAARAIEAEAMLSLGAASLQDLKTLLTRISASFGANAPVAEHMDILARPLRDLLDASLSPISK